ncbi:MAG: PEPxxWA-CTERM sorting domain-containing protein [Phenylobacterium sp.]
MNFRKHLAGLAACALVLGAAGAANATQYILQYTDVASFGSGPFGTVDVTGTATDLRFEINVSPNQIVDTGGHYAVAMNLSGSGFALAGAPAGLSLDIGTISSSPFSGFNIGVNCDQPTCGNGGSGPYPVSPLVFHITGTGLGVLDATPYNGHTINFAVDILAPPTGVVGGGLGGGGGVPEPATWGLMILGFGGAGAALRSNRRRKAVAFA